MDMMCRDSVCVVTLSRRNLETLLKKLDDPDSVRTLVKQTEDGPLVVIAEEDEEHYKGRTPGRVKEDQDVEVPVWVEAERAA